MILDLYVTLGSNQLKKKPYKEQIKGFLKCDGENFVFNWYLSRLPKKSFLNVYIVIGNKVRWKAKFLDFEYSKDPVYDANGNIKSSSFNMILFDFEKMKFPQEKLRGFQGFRYRENVS